MSAVTRRDFASLLHLVSLSAVAAATVGVFFGVGFSLIAPPHAPVAPLKDPAPGAEAVQVEELQSPENNDAAGRSSSAPSSPHEVAASPMLSALSEQQPPLLGSVETHTVLVNPTHVIHAKKIRVRQRRREATARHWAVLWRPDASAGPNAGGGFYGPPNINIGYINPR